MLFLISYLSSSVQVIRQSTKIRTLCELIEKHSHDLRVATKRRRAQERSVEGELQSKRGRTSNRCQIAVTPAGVASAVFLPSETNRYSTSERALGAHNKFVVFSKWPLLLVLAKHALETKGFGTVILSCMDDASLIQFQTDPRTSCLLIHTCHGEGIAGLNLTVASHVVLIEPSMDYRIEAQAIARVHRLGQTKHVYVHRMCARGTIDEEIIRITKSRQHRDARNLSADDDKTSEILDMFGVVCGKKRRRNT